MELTVSPAPHIHDNLTVSKCMYNVIIALLPAFAVSLYFWQAICSVKRNDTLFTYLYLKEEKLFVKK